MTPPVKETPVQAEGHIAMTDVPDRDMFSTPTSFVNVIVKLEALKIFGIMITGG